jgi:hypothetical protein
VKNDKRLYLNIHQNKQKTTTNLPHPKLFSRNADIPQAKKVRQNEYLFATAMKYNICLFSRTTHR